MTKHIDIILAVRWEDKGYWNEYSSNWNKRLATSKFRVFCDTPLPDLPRSMNLSFARSLAATHGGELIEVADPNPQYVGYRKTHGYSRTAYEQEELLRRDVNSGERQVGYIVRVPAASIIMGKLAGRIEGMEISDKAKNRWVYRSHCHEFRVNEEEHNRYLTGHSYMNGRPYQFVRYIRKSFEVGQ